MTRLEDGAVARRVPRVELAEEPSDDVGPIDAVGKRPPHALVPKRRVAPRTDPDLEVLPATRRRRENPEPR